MHSLLRTLRLPSVRSRRAGIRQAFLRRTALAAAVLVVASGCAVQPGGIGVERATQVQPTTSGWLHTDGGTIRDAADKPFVIKSVSWFGLETPECAPHGLWSINLEDGLRQIRSMGFNTIRLPYSNQCITRGTSTSVDYSLNPSLEGRTPLQVMDSVVDAAGAAGLNVILDRHRPESKAQSELWHTPAITEDQWIADWKMLAARYKDNPVVIGADLHNEPRGAACWACGDPARDWKAAATRAGNAVLSANPNLLVIVEGIENEADGTATWWGSGLRGVAANPVTLERDHRVVYSPHDYPASVHHQQWFSDPTYPENLPALWDRNWGYIAREGIAPVLLGEFGTKLETDSDRQWLDQMVAYLGRTGMSYSYWSFNPNSGDTGGLVKDDWRTEETAKTLALKPLLTTSPAPSPSPTSPVPSPSPTSPVPSPSPTSPVPSPSPTSPVPSPSPTSPEPSPSPTSPAPVPLTPLQSSVPSVAGIARVGHVLTATPGPWTAGTALKYAWHRDGVAIPGATTARHALTARDLGARMTVVVSGTRNGYAPASRTSRPGPTVSRGTLTGSKPTITGSGRVGQPLTADPGTWSPGAVVTFQWYRSGTPIAGARSRTYTPTSADRNVTLHVQATGTKTGYTPLTKHSRSTGRIAG
ncbi:cellulase family glycosylhydrolase [Arthrobacter sp. TMS2-4]